MRQLTGLGGSPRNCSSNALQRAPTAKDRATATAFLDRYTAAVADAPPGDRTKAAWAALARVLLASNEFLYLD